LKRRYPEKVSVKLAEAEEISGDKSNNLQLHCKVFMATEALA